MAIGISTEGTFYEIGSASFLHSFFSTVSYYLETDGWGSKYPLLMNNLYQGSLKWEHSEVVLKNILEIRESLKKFSPDKIIWDIENLSMRPPWGDNISPDITDLSNYFITSDGNDLFDVLVSILAESINEKADIHIE
ncbi:MAG TPA: hypothetical protein DEQ02_10835 [Ruminococcaceae bacterium]|nr:hypothetical protein [Oscillospiraceae bacterium]